jgi:FkbM family methyltransferase
MSGAVDRAERSVLGEAGTAWDAPSSLGRGPARRLLRRVLRPFEVRQRELDRTLVEALRGIESRIGREMRGPGMLALASRLDGAELTGAKTEVGDLWLRRDDKLVAPTIIEHGLYAPDVVEILRRNLSTGGTFIDVGANIGYFSVAASPMVGRRGRVFSVEPDPRNAAVLRANLWRNRCDNATVLPVAAWSKRTHLNLVTYPEGGAATEVSSDASAKGDGRLVPAERLDDLVEGSADLIKIDAQMTDHHAVQGAERLISSNPDVVVIAEFFPAALRAQGDDPEEIAAYYQSLGLGLHLIKPYTLVELVEVDTAGAIEACANPEIPFVDLVMFRR